MITNRPNATALTRLFVDRSRWLFDDLVGVWGTKVRCDTVNITCQFALYPLKQENVVNNRSMSATEIRMDVRH